MILDDSSSLELSDSEHDDASTVRITNAFLETPRQLCLRHCGFISAAEAQVSSAVCYCTVQYALRQVLQALAEIVGFQFFGKRTARCLNGAAAVHPADHCPSCLSIVRKHFSLFCPASALQS
jgi:hypothetical protein